MWEIANERGASWLAVLAAGLAAVCCHNVQTAGSEPLPDAGTDTDTDADSYTDGDADVDTDADTDLDFGCPDWTGDYCVGTFDETEYLPVLIAAGELPLAGAVRFVDLEIATLDHDPSALGILAEVDPGDGQWTPTVLTVSLEDTAWEETPVVAIAQGAPMAEEHEAVALVDQLPESLEWSFVALTCAADACQVAGVADVDGPLEPISTIELAPDERVNGLSGLGEEVIAFGTRLRSSADLIEWAEVDGVGAGAVLNDFGSYFYWFYDDVPHGAVVGDAGRMVEYLDGEWIEHVPSTASDLRAVLVDSDRFFAVGDAGALVARGPGYPELCELMDLDFTAMSRGDGSASVGTSGGDVLGLCHPWIDEEGYGACMLPAVGGPVLALRYQVFGDEFWLFALTEEALHAAMIGGLL